jgi:hypothetical protein
MQKSTEKSQQQADIIMGIAIPMMMLDIPYCKAAAKDMKDQARRQESMAVLNPSHSLIKNDILRKQGDALSFLCQYAETLKEIQELKITLSKENDNQAMIKRLFM